MPCTATIEPGRASIWRSALYTVSPGAQQRCRVEVGESVGDAGQSACPAVGNLGVASVDGATGHRLIRAVDEVAPAAQLADPAVPAEVSDADPLAGQPGGNAAADRVDDSHQFVPGDDRLLRVGAASLDRARVAVADAAGENAEPDVPG